MNQRYHSNRRRSRSCDDISSMLTRSSSLQRYQSPNPMFLSNSGQPSIYRIQRNGTTRSSAGSQRRIRPQSRNITTTDANSEAQNCLRVPSSSRTKSSSTHSVATTTTSVPAASRQPSLIESKYANSEYQDSVLEEDTFRRLSVRDGDSVAHQQWLEARSTDRDSDNPFMHPNNSVKITCTCDSRLIRAGQRMMKGFSAIQYRLFSRNSATDRLSSEAKVLKMFPDFKHLRKIYLSDMGLSSLPDAICTLDNAEFLALDVNRFKTIPAPVIHMRSLKTLYIHHNKISTIPIEVHNMTNLRLLAMQYNKLTAMPPALFTIPNLKFLNVSYNNIPDVPTGIKDAISLRGLWLSGNKLNSVPESLRAMNKLQILHLDDNRIKSTPEWLWKMRKLTDLVLVDGNKDIDDSVICQRISHRNKNLKIGGEMSTKSPDKAVSYYQQKLESGAPKMNSKELLSTLRNTRSRTIQK